MQLKLHRRCTIMISIFLVILIIAVAYLTMNADAWRDRFLEVMIIIVAVSTVFLVFFKYYENNADKNIINKMVREDRYALAKIKDGKFERNSIGQPAGVIRPGYPKEFLEEYVKQTGDRYRMPE